MKVLMSSNEKKAKPNRLLRLCRELVCFYRAHALLYIALCLCALLAHGGLFFSGHFYNDENYLLRFPGDPYNWLTIGRYSLVLFKRLFGTLLYNPSAEAAFFFLLLPLALLTWGFLLEKGSALPHGAALFVSLLLILVFPAFTEQYYFRFQAFPFACGMLCTALSLLCAFEGLADAAPYGRRGEAAAVLLFSVLFALLAFGVYQSFVNLYLTGLLGVFLLRRARGLQRALSADDATVSGSPTNETEPSDSLTGDAEVSGSDDAAARGRFFPVPLISFAKHCALFLFSFLLYMLLVRLFFSGSDYLTSQLPWGNVSVTDILRALFSYFLHMLLARSVFYPATFILVCLFLPLALCLRGRFALLPLSFAFLLSEMLLPLISGAAVPYRSQTSLPFVCGIGAYIAFCLLADAFADKRGTKDIAAALTQGAAASDTEEKDATAFPLPAGFTGKANRKIAGLLLSLLWVGALFCLLREWTVTARIYHTYDSISKCDETRARQMADRIALLDEGRGLPVIFYGRLDAEADNISYPVNSESTYLFFSAFELDFDIAPAGYFNTMRIGGLLSDIGVFLPLPTAEQALSYQAAAVSEMEPWPAEESVREFAGEVIVVLLSDE